MGLPAPVGPDRVEFPLTPCDNLSVQTFFFTLQTGKLTP